MEPQGLIDKAPNAFEQVLNVLVSAGNEPIAWVFMVGVMALIGLKIWRRK